MFLDEFTKGTQYFFPNVPRPLRKGFKAYFYFLKISNLKKNQNYAKKIELFLFFGFFKVCSTFDLLDFLEVCSMGDLKGISQFEGTFFLGKSLHFPFRVSASAASLVYREMMRIFCLECCKTF